MNYTGSNEFTIQEAITLAHRLCLAIVSLPAACHTPSVIKVYISIDIKCCQVLFIYDLWFLLLVVSSTVFIGGCQ